MSVFWQQNYIKMSVFRQQNYIKMSVFRQNYGKHVKPTRPEAIQAALFFNNDNSIIVFCRQCQ